MAELTKHRGRHKWQEDDTGVLSCAKCGKPKPQLDPPPEPEKSVA